MMIIHGSFVSKMKINNGVLFRAKQQKKTETKACDESRLKYFQGQER